MHIINWVRKRPTLLFTLAFGLFSFVVLSLMNGGKATSSVTKAAAEVSDKVGGAVTDVKEVVGDAASSVSNTTKEIVEKVKDVDLSIAPKLESSDLTKALVSGGDESDTAQKNEAESTVANTTENSEANKPDVQAVADSDATVSPEFNEAKPDELLLMAREAYWNNGLDESAQIYQQLIALEPEKIEYRGELGNVFWRQGFPKKAAELYASIALPMIEDGNADRVANMVGFIGLYYPEKATEIHNKLQAIQ